MRLIIIRTRETREKRREEKRREDKRREEKRREEKRRYVEKLILSFTTYKLLYTYQPHTAPHRAAPRYTGTIIPPTTYHLPHTTYHIPHTMPYAMYNQCIN